MGKRTNKHDFFITVFPHSESHGKLIVQGGIHASNFPYQKMIYFIKNTVNLFEFSFKKSYGIIKKKVV